MKKPQNSINHSLHSLDISQVQVQERSLFKYQFRIFDEITGPVDVSAPLYLPPTELKPKTLCLENIVISMTGKLKVAFFSLVYPEDFKKRPAVVHNIKYSTTSLVAALPIDNINE